MTDEDLDAMSDDGVTILTLMRMHDGHTTACAITLRGCICGRESPPKQEGNQ